MSVNIPLRTAFAVSQILELLCFYFHLPPGIFLTFSFISSVIHSLFSIILFIFHISVFFCHFFL